MQPSLHCSYNKRYQ